MLPRLYLGEEKDFKHNGLGFLKDCINCYATEELNGSFELELTYPYNSRLVDSLTEENIIKCNASYNLPNQLFRIYKVSKSLDGNYKVNAQHISYDLMTDFCERAKFTSISCAGALQRIFDMSSQSKHFKAFSDLRDPKDVDIFHSDIYSCIKGQNGSLIDTFYTGAEILRDNFNFHILKKRGKAKDLLAHYGKNVSAFDSDLDYTDLCTVIYPFAKIKEEWNGYDKTISLPEKYIESPYAKNYKRKYIKPVDFTSDTVRNVADLRREASKYFSRTRRDVPIRNFKIKLVNEKVNLGDSILVRIPKLGIDASIKIVKLKFNVLTNTVEDIEMGRLKQINFKTKGGL